jgi:hypothetical protein
LGPGLLGLAAMDLIAIFNQLVQQGKPLT